MGRINLGAVEVPKAKAPTVVLSKQQENVIDFVRNGSGNAILEAVAGSGKTFTLVEMCKYLTGTAAFAAFNKKIADEIGIKLLQAGVDKRAVKAATFHSFGFQAWRRAAGRVNVDGDKKDTVMDSIGVPPKFRGFVAKSMSIAKQSGIMCSGGPELNDLQWWYAMVEHFDLEESLYDSDSYEIGNLDELVDAGIEMTQMAIEYSMTLDNEVIDFDDMIWSPLVHNASMWQNDWVLIDEAQDTNAARRLMAIRMLKPDGRLVAVGDRHQAIYGFTGADADSLDLIRDSFAAQQLPLTVTYRCPQAVVREAQKYVPHIKAWDEAEEGLVKRITEPEFKAIVPEKTDAILCRNTRPLMEIAFNYIRKKIPCHVEGRDIGQGLLRLANQWRKVKTIEDLVKKLDEFLAKEEKRLADKQGRLASVRDKVETLQVMCRMFALDENLNDLRKLIYDLFKDTEGQTVTSVTLSTVHKAKGREWQRVYIYGANKYMPSPWARQLWQVEQEHNLLYVAITRSQNELIFVDLVA